MNKPNDEGFTSLDEIASEDEISLEDLYKRLYEHGDLIIIIDRQDEFRVRKGLSNIKAKETAKLKAAGVRPEEVVLEFAEHDYEDKTKIKLQMHLKSKPSIKIHKFIIPED